MAPANKAALVRRVEYGGVGAAWVQRFISGCLLFRLLILAARAARRWSRASFIG
jgi:hypothetical protein